MIKCMHGFETQKIPSGITVIKPDELNRIWMKQLDLNEYKKIHVIGDIHGCNTALQEYIGDGINADEFYIFTGDYVDRGIENADVIKFLLSIYNRDNVFLLEGNHEKWLWVWANDGVSKSKEFELITKTELDNQEVSKKEVRKLYRKIGQCAFFTYAGNVYLITHAGLSALPENLTLVSTRQMVKGVGNYNDFEAVANSFLSNTPENCFQIHGHRNTKRLPVKVNERCFNLEGQVEFGGCLRCVDLLPDGTQEVFEIQNNVFKECSEPEQAVEAGAKSVGDVIIELRQNKYVQERKYGNISSFNFTKSAFYDRVWNEQTMKARGLYINIPKQKVVARAYNKFFNINERPETKFDMLHHKLVFPVSVYVKENGFLGIVSYNEEDESLFITTKSSPDGDFAGYFRDMLYDKISPEKLDEIKSYTKEHNVSLVFECVDMKNDPHIIEYPESKLFLLDVIYNDLEFKKYTFEDMIEVASRFGLAHKEWAYVIETWQDFFDWYYTVVDDDYKYDGRNIEGFVIEDADGYMVKLKLAYYNFWKFMRGISHEAIRKGYINPQKTSALLTPLANQYYAWVKTLHDAENVELIPKDICTLRRWFFESDMGRQFAE